MSLIYLISSHCPLSTITLNSSFIIIFLFFSFSTVQISTSQTAKSKLYLELTHTIPVSALASSFFSQYKNLFLFTSFSYSSFSSPSSSLQRALFRQCKTTQGGGGVITFLFCLLFSSRSLSGRRHSVSGFAGYLFAIAVSLRFRARR